MDAHSVETWRKIINGQCSLSDLETVADRIIGDLVAYPHHSKYRAHDRREMANAIAAVLEIVNEEH